MASGWILLLGLLSALLCGVEVSRLAARARPAGRLRAEAGRTGRPMRIRRDRRRAGRRRSDPRP
jgi:hypothetical protein